MLLDRSNLNIPANFRRFFAVFQIRNAKKFDFFPDFAMIFADFHEIYSDFLIFSRKTLQLLETSRFQFNFIMISFNFRFNVLFDFELNDFIFHV